MLTVLSMNCCKNNCLKFLSPSDIECVREKLETEQTQLVIDYLNNHSNKDGKVLHSIAGRQVCEKCWRLVYGIRYNRYQAINTIFMEFLKLSMADKG